MKTKGMDGGVGGGGGYRSVFLGGWLNTTSFFIFMTFQIATLVLISLSLHPLLNLRKLIFATSIS
jgi:hypothetical protein